MRGHQNGKSKSLVREESERDSDRDNQCINEIVKNQYFLSTLVVIVVTLYTCDGFQQVHSMRMHMFLCM